MKRSLIVLDRGFEEYKITWDLMKNLVEKRLAGYVPDHLILVEHDHVITLGRSGKLENVLDKSLPLYMVERGGDATYHGPGQLVAYPIIHLPENNLTVSDFLEKIKKALLQTMEDFGLNARVDSRYVGVWVDNKKVVSIGMALKRKKVSYHGVAINISTDLSYFFKINPCGLDAAIMTSMNELLKKTLSMDMVKEKFIRNFVEVFDFEPVKIIKKIT